MFRSFDIGTVRNAPNILGGRERSIGNKSEMWRTTDNHVQPGNEEINRAIDKYELIE